MLRNVKTVKTAIELGIVKIRLDSMNMSFADWTKASTMLTMSGYYRPTGTDVYHKGV